MAFNTDLSTIKDKLKAAKDIYILIPQNPNQDSVASGLSLYLSLKSDSTNTYIACPSPMRVEFSRLVGVDKVSSKIGNRNLVVSFDQTEVEKVTYNLEGEKLNLVVIPKPGSKPLDPKDASYSYTGAEAELVFIIQATSYESLGSLYAGEKELFTKAHTVSVSRFQTPPFAQTTITDPKASSICEVTAELLEKLGLQPTNDIASNLLAGIDYATARFSSPAVTGSTFSLAAQLMKNGAKRQVLKPVLPPARGFPPKTTPIAPAVTTPPHPASTAPSATTMTQPMTQAVSAKKPPLPLEPQDQSLDQPLSDQPPPQDWLEPKIYSTTTKV